MQACMRTHIRLRVRLRACVCLSVHVCDVFACMRACTRACVRVCTCACVRMCVRISVCLCVMDTCVSVRVRASYVHGCMDAVKAEDVRRRRVGHGCISRDTSMLVRWHRLMNVGDRIVRRQEHRHTYPSARSP